MSTIVSTQPIREKKTFSNHSLAASILDRIGMASGIAFVVLLFTASSMVADPPAHGPYQLMADFYRENEGSFTKSVYLATLALMFFILFAGTLSNLVRRADKSNGWLPSVMLGSGLVTAVMMIISQACQGATALMGGRNANPELIRAMDEISHIIAHLFAAPLGVFLLTASAGILLYRVAPRWLSILSVLSGTTLVSVAGTFSSTHLLHSIGVLALLMFMLWTVLMSVVLIWRSRETTIG